MLKLNAGFSRKVGEPSFGSRGASVNVELEVESSLINSPEHLRERIRDLFKLARESVDRELDTTAPPNNGHANDRFGESSSGNGRTPARSATVSQVRAIRAICQRQNIDADRIANERFSVTAVEELTLQEASSFIDELKSAPTNGQNGGGR